MLADPPHSARDDDGGSPDSLVVSELIGPAGVAVPLVGDAPEFEICISCDLDSAVVTVRGELDIATAPLLQSRLLELIDVGMVHVELELTAMTFMDSSGLAALIDGWRRMSQIPNGTFILKSPNPSTRRVLDISGVATLFTIT